MTSVFLNAAHLMRRIHATTADVNTKPSEEVNQ